MTVKDLAAITRRDASPTGFHATCNLPTTRSTTDFQESLQHKGTKWNQSNDSPVYTWEEPCGFGETTDREEFERHMHQVHGRKASTWVDRQGGTPAWARQDLSKPHRVVVNKGDEVDLGKISKAGREAIKQCRDCGTVYELDVEHKLTCQGWA